MRCQAHGNIQSRCSKCPQNWCEAHGKFRDKCSKCKPHLICEQSKIRKVNCHHNMPVEYQRQKYREWRSKRKLEKEAVATIEEMASQRAKSSRDVAPTAEYPSIGPVVIPTLKHPLGRRQVLGGAAEHLPGAGAGEGGGMGEGRRAGKTVGEMRDKAPLDHEEIRTREAIKACRLNSN